MEAIASDRSLDDCEILAGNHRSSKSRIQPLENRRSPPVLFCRKRNRFQDQQVPIFGRDEPPVLCGSCGRARAVVPTCFPRLREFLLAVERCFSDDTALTELYTLSLHDAAALP